MNLFYLIFALILLNVGGIILHSVYSYSCVDIMTSPAVYGSNFDCPNYLSCLSTTMNCATGTNCLLSCTGKSSCAGVTLNCASGSNCRVVCSGDYACQDMKINCPGGGADCLVQKTGDLFRPILVYSDVTSGNIQIDAINPQFVVDYIGIGKLLIRASGIGNIEVTGSSPSSPSVVSSRSIVVEQQYPSNIYTMIHCGNSGSCNLISGQTTDVGEELFCEHSPSCKFMSPNGASPFSSVVCLDSTFTPLCTQSKVTIFCAAPIVQDCAYDCTL